MQFYSERGSNNLVENSLILDRNSSTFRIKDTTMNHLLFTLMQDQ